MTDSNKDFSFEAQQKGKKVRFMDMPLRTCEGSGCPAPHQDQDLPEITIHRGEMSVDDPREFLRVMREQSPPEDPEIIIDNGEIYSEDPRVLQKMIRTEKATRSSGLAEPDTPATMTVPGGNITREDF